MRKGPSHSPELFGQPHVSLRQTLQKHSVAFQNFLHNPHMVQYEVCTAQASSPFGCKFETGSPLARLQAPSMRHVTCERERERGKAEAQVSSCKVSKARCNTLAITRNWFSEIKVWGRSLSSPADSTTSWTSRISCEQGIVSELDEAAEKRVENLKLRIRATRTGNWRKGTR